MRRASPEDEAVIPRISTNYFTRESSAAYLEKLHYVIRSLHDFSAIVNVIGWALANDVSPNLAMYVVLFEREDEILWCHCSGLMFENMVEQVRLNPARKVSLR